MGARKFRPKSLAAVLAGRLPRIRISIEIAVVYSRFNLVPDRVSEPRSR